MAIFGILALIFIPVVGAARERARTGICQSSLRSWHSAILVFANEYVDRILQGYYRGQPGDGYLPVGPAGSGDVNRRRYKVLWRNLRSTLKPIRRRGSSYGPGRNNIDQALTRD